MYTFIVFTTREFRETRIGVPERRHTFALAITDRRPAFYFTRAPEFHGNGDTVVLMCFPFDTLIGKHDANQEETYEIHVKRVTLHALLKIRSLYDIGWVYNQVWPN